MPKAICTRNFVVTFEPLSPGLVALMQAATLRVSTIPTARALAIDAVQAAGWPEVRWDEYGPAPCCQTSISPACDVPVKWPAVDSVDIAAQHQ